MEAVSITLRPFSKSSKPSLLDHDTTAELLLLTGTDQLLDIKFRLDAGAQGPTALLGQEGERPLGRDGGLELQVLWGLRVEMWPLADVQTSLQKMGSRCHGGQGRGRGVKRVLLLPQVVLEGDGGLLTRREDRLSRGVGKEGSGGEEIVGGRR